MDNNILAYSKHLGVLEELVNSQIKLQFNQGLDLRLLNDANAYLLAKLNYLGEYIFAFDDVKDEAILTENLFLFKRYVPKDWKCKVYIYHNEQVGSISDLIHRVWWCRKHKVLPYVMRDINCWASENNEFLIDYAAYCNQPNLFKKMDFTLFLTKRHTNQNRIAQSLAIYQKHGGCI